MGCSASTQTGERPLSSATRVPCEDDEDHQRHQADPVGLPVPRPERSGSFTPPGGDDVRRSTNFGGEGCCSDDVAPFRISSSFESDAQQQQQQPTLHAFTPGKPPPPHPLSAWRSTSGEHDEADVVEKDVVAEEAPLKKEETDPSQTRGDLSNSSPRATEVAFAADAGEAGPSTAARLRRSSSSTASSTSPAPLRNRIDTAPFLASSSRFGATHSLRRRSSQEGTVGDQKGDEWLDDDVEGAVDSASPTGIGQRRVSVSSSQEGGGATGWSFRSATTSVSGGDGTAGVPQIAVSGSASMRHRKPSQPTSAFAPPLPPQAASGWATAAAAAAGAPADPSRRSSSRASPRLSIPAPSPLSGASLLIHGAGAGGGIRSVRTGNSPSFNTNNSNAPPSRRASLTTTAGGSVDAVGQQQQQQPMQSSTLLMTSMGGDDATTLAFSAFTSRSSSIASGMSAAAVIPFTFLNSNELKRDTNSEHARMRSADDAVVSLADLLEDVQGLASTTSGGVGSRANKAKHSRLPSLAGDLCGPVLVLPDCGADLTAVLLVLNAMETYCVQEHNRMLCTLFSYVIATGRSGHIALFLAQGESIQDITQFVLEQEAFLLRPPKEGERDRGGGPSGSRQVKRSTPCGRSYYTDQSTLFDTVVKLHFADQAVSGWTDTDTTRRMFHRFRRGDHYVLRPLIPVLVVPPPSQQSQTADEGRGVQREEEDDLQRRGVRLVDWRSTALVHRMVQVAANGMVAIDDRPRFLEDDEEEDEVVVAHNDKDEDDDDDDDDIDTDMLSFDDDSAATKKSSTRKKHRPRAALSTAGENESNGNRQVSTVCAGLDEIPDPLLLALHIEPRPSVVCRIRISHDVPPSSSAQGVESPPPRRNDMTALMETEFGEDFIDIVLPPPSSTASSVPPPSSTPYPPPQGLPSPTAAASRSRTERGSIPAVGASGEWRGVGGGIGSGGGELSAMSLGLEVSISPMESLLRSLSTPVGGGGGAGGGGSSASAPPPHAKRRRAAYARQIESFVTEEEGTLMRVVDYIVVKAAKPRVLTPPDYDFGLPNSIWS